MTRKAGGSRPTVKEVAQVAGVSVATVSRALNHMASVDAALAARVQRAAEDLGYRRNMNARSLRRRSADAIALIISDVSNPFFTEVTRGVEDAANERGLSVLLCNSYEDADKEAAYLDVAESQQVAGVIISPHGQDADVSQVQRAGIPVVVIDRPLAGAFDSILVDSKEGARAATEHLLDEGWIRPGCITGQADTQTARDRLAGYLEAVGDSGITPRYAQTTSAQEGFAEATGRLLDSPEPPDSLFVANAHMCLQVIGELTRRGLDIGTDIGIVTFDDAPWAPFVNSGISAVAQPAYEVGSRAAELLMERISGDQPRPVRNLVLTTSLVVRASSRRSRDR